MKATLIAAALACAASFALAQYGGSNQNNGSQPSGSMNSGVPSSDSQRNGSQTSGSQTGDPASAPSMDSATSMNSTPVPVTETEAVAEILKINKADKTVTIKDSMGKRLTINVPADVYSLDTLKTGSKLSLRYVQPMAVAISKSGTSSASGTPSDSATPSGSATSSPSDMASNSGKDTVHFAPKTGSPSDVVVNTKVLTGTVQNIDLAKREIRVKAPEGQMTFKATDDLQGFDQVKVGDTATLRYTDAVALSATPSTKEMSGSQSR